MDFLQYQQRSRSQISIKLILVLTDQTVEVLHDTQHVRARREAEQKQKG